MSLSDYEYHVSIKYKFSLQSCFVGYFTMFWACVHTTHNRYIEANISIAAQIKLEHLYRTCFLPKYPPAAYNLLTCRDFWYKCTIGALVAQTFCLRSNLMAAYSIITASNFLKSSIHFRISYALN